MQSDTGPTVAEADCLFILALSDDGLVGEENGLVGVPDDVEADADVVVVVLKEARISSTAEMASLAVLAFSVATA